MSQTKSRSVSARASASPWARCAAWRRYSCAPKANEHEPAQHLNGHAMVLHGARNGADAQRRAQRDQAVAQHGAEASRNARPRSRARSPRWMQSTLTGPTGAADKNSDDDADGNDEWIRQKVHSRSLVGPHRGAKACAARGCSPEIIRDIVRRRRSRRRRQQRHLSRHRSSLMLRLAALCSSRFLVLVLAGLLIVYRGPSCALEGRGPSAGPQENGTPPRAAEDAQATRGERRSRFPEPVEEMREAILAAARSGHIEELRRAARLERAEARTSAPSRRGSRSPTGRRPPATARAARCWPRSPISSRCRHASVPLGKDLENNLIYVWPYLAEAELDKLTPAAGGRSVAPRQPAEAAKAMREKKKWTWWRLTIGADGTWHSLPQGRVRRRAASVHLRRNKQLRNW